MSNYINKLRQKIGKDPLFSPGASVIVYENNKYLLQFRKDFNVWGLHGGAMELGETGADVCVRELEEETGLKALEIHPFRTYCGKHFVINYPNGDVVYPVVMAFLVTKTQGKLSPQDDEVAELKWFDEASLPIDAMMEIDKTFLKDFLQHKNQTQPQTYKTKFCQAKCLC
ncbi:NUDIX hydrolase [Chrysanthemum yellows phytoplasma]|uniref:NUDIX hydrolase n=1 Tax=Chrysanthemum yellows phytoplasma TaxID=238674 RepID=UPI00054CB134|nr:NUDIX hydrolase [Chrysanthemum yellows phytoplasma]PWV43929.1 MAG: NUDIX domain-containing protein ['Brassica napus' phytoplasma]